MKYLLDKDPDYPKEDPPPAPSPPSPPPDTSSPKKKFPSKIQPITLEDFKTDQNMFQNYIQLRDKGIANLKNTSQKEARGRASNRHKSYQIS